MPHKLALLVVDICEGLEDLLKSNERGYSIDFDYVRGCWVRSPQAEMAVQSEIIYPYGSLRAGFNAIIDTASIACKKGKKVYASYFYTGWTDGEEQPAQSLMHCVNKEDTFEKTTYSAFQSGKLALRLKKDECKHLLILGYDRDCCVLATAKDAVNNGIKVVTCEQLMLTANKGNKKDISLDYFKKNTVFLESVVDALNYIQRD